MKRNLIHLQIITFNIETGNQRIILHNLKIKQTIKCYFKDKKNIFKNLTYFWDFYQI